MFGGHSALRSSLRLLPIWLEAEGLEGCPGPAMLLGQLCSWPSTGLSSLTPPPTQEKEQQRLENLRRKEKAEQLRRLKVEEDKRRQLEEMKL